MVVLTCKGDTCPSAWRQEHDESYVIGFHNTSLFFEIYLPCYYLRKLEKNEANFKKKLKYLNENNYVL